MKKKKTIIFICIACMVILVIAALLLIKHYNDLKEEKELEAEHQRLMEEAVEEIEYINSNSDLFGFKMLENSAFVQGEWILDGGEYVGSYCSSKFEGRTRITQLGIESSGGNILGIHTGDMYEIAENTMKERDYILFDEGKGYPSNTTRYIYKKGYVSIVFDVFPDNTIESLSVGVSDPTIPRIIS